jgi:membrane-bound metal-dependent hydrolase YbcI (DUF457 family)
LRARIAVGGVVHVLVGAFLAALFPLLWQFSAVINGAPKVLPPPIALFIRRLLLGYHGLTNAISMVGTGMLPAGLGATWLAVRRRSASAAEPGLDSGTAGT